MGPSVAHNVRALRLPSGYWAAFHLHHLHCLTVLASPSKTEILFPNPPQRAKLLRR
jgi:hypothetical protein